VVKVIRTEKKQASITWPNTEDPYPTMIASLD